MIIVCHNQTMTQTDIAKALGLSLSTVQRALNNTGYVSQEVREKVDAYVKETGYNPDRLAQALASRSVKRLGIFSSDYPAYFWDELERGIRTAEALIRPFGFETTYYRIPRGDTAAYSRIVENAIETGLDAAAIVNNYVEFDMASIFARFETSEIPYLCFNIDSPDSKRICFIGPDYRNEGILAAELLGRFLPPRGKIAILTSRVNHTDRLGGLDILHERFLGFSDTISRHFPQLRFVASWLPLVETGDNSEAIIRELLNSGIDGLYCSTPHHFSLCQAIQKNSWEIQPRVITSDLPERMRPFLQDRTITAAIHQSPAIQGIATVRRLEELVTRGKNHQFRNIIVSHRIILDVGVESDDSELLDPRSDTQT